MSAEFDPYHKWLGIPPAEQPPNHYRLLAIEPFEADPEVIEHAADRQMAHLRTFQAGRQGPLSQKLLNEVAAAKICLLNAEKKTAYDVQLCRVMDARSAGEDTSSHEHLLRVLGFSEADDGYRAVTARPIRSNLKGKTVVAVGMVLVLSAATIAWWSSTGRERRPEPVAKRAVAAKRSEAAPPAQSKPKPQFAQSPVVTVSNTKPEPKQPVEPAQKPAPKPRTPEKKASAAAEPKPKPEAEAPSHPVAKNPPVASAPTDSPSPPAQPATAERKRLPIPSQAEQDRAMKVAQDIYRSDYDQAKTPAAKQALARKMLEQATSSEISAAERFVLLGLARDVSAQAADCDLAFRAVERLAESYEIKPLVMKAGVVGRAAEEAQSLEARVALVEWMLGIAEDAVYVDETELAHDVLKRALGLAAKARDRQLVQQVRDCLLKLEESQKGIARVAAARALLRERPQDAEAMVVVGRHLCLVEGDWDTGLPLLAAGSDARLKELAQRDLVAGGTDVTAASQVAVADAWWEIAQRCEASERRGMLLRAGCWYFFVSQRVKDLSLRSHVEKRLEGIRKLSVPIDPAPFGRLGGLPRTIVNSIGTKLVLIPAGEFMMGTSEAEVEELLAQGRQQNTPEVVMRHLPSESPHHLVRLTRPFYCGCLEVTQSEYMKVMGAKPSHFAPTASLKLPVGRVAWTDAVEFCGRLSALPRERAARRHYRLPSEAEWEYACRAGTSGRYSFGNEERLARDYAWTEENSGGRVHPTGEKSPNRWGLYDMHGNLAEWCSDFYGSQYYTKSPLQDPPGPTTGPGRVARGSDFARPAWECRSSYRRAFRGDVRELLRGFRIVCDIPSRED